MKLLFPVFAALGFLVTAGDGGGTRCGRTVPGQCRVHCHPTESASFICLGYKQCCVKNYLVPKPISPPVHKPKSQCRTTPKSHYRKQRTLRPSKPPSPSRMPNTITHPSKPPSPSRMQNTITHP